MFECALPVQLRLNKVIQQLSEWNQASDNNSGDSGDDAEQSDYSKEGNESTSHSVFKVTLI